MYSLFETIIQSLAATVDLNQPNADLSHKAGSNGLNDNAIQIYRSLNTAFLLTLVGNRQFPQLKAKSFLMGMRAEPQFKDVTNFYLDGIERIKREVEEEYTKNKGFARRVSQLAAWCAENTHPSKNSGTAQQFWTLFFPEGTGIWSREDQRIEDLQRKRLVRITGLKKTPLSQPIKQILFTSNVLFTLPSASREMGDLALSDGLKLKITSIDPGPQRCWYDHPIQLGAPPEGNEVIYGLEGLQNAINFDRQRGAINEDEKLTCVLSISVTHDGIARIAKEYLEEQLAFSPPFENLEVFLFTETDTKRIIEEILKPAARHYLKLELNDNSFNVFGVDGAYGRHYSFLKAIAAFWSILIDPQIKATFKIDLDQVFPQNELLSETGLSAFEHFKSPLWGAEGLDSENNPVELGMLAGALVNESDIHKSLFTADVPFPSSKRLFSPDEYIFLSMLPQALSTQAEMMARYNSSELDGVTACSQRLHVTGGTNGILIDSLRRHRPFTPSFIGRAEDQAYLLSVFPEKSRQLVYFHKDGLIMRHDKEAFAQDAIQTAHIGKLIGDYERILYFSSYARAINNDLNKIKNNYDPFTGCFISHIPITLCLLRFCLKFEALFVSGQEEQAIEFVCQGVKRLTNVLNFTFGSKQDLENSVHTEREDWDLYYNTLTAIEDGLQNKHQFAQEMYSRAKDIVGSCVVKT